jgi:hypothetical protein
MHHRFLGYPALTDGQHRHGGAVAVRDDGGRTAVAGQQWPDNSRPQFNTGYSRILVHCAEEELPHSVHGRVRCRRFAAMEAELARVPAHCAQELARVVRPASHLGKEVEAVEGIWSCRVCRVWE